MVALTHRLGMQEDAAATMDEALPDVVDKGQAKTVRFPPDQ